MPKGILGRKIGMTQIFTEDGQFIPVTVIEATPNTVVQKKTKETDGYEAVQLGFGEKREKLMNKPMRGHIARAGLRGVRYLREFRAEGVKQFENVKPGDTIRVDIFQTGELVDVTGTSKGKGFAGAIKRWGFHRGPMEHGSMYHRRPGSLGATDPARVFKGRKLPGRMGNARRTVQGLEVVHIDPERHLLVVKGSVPGAKGSLVKVQESVKVRQAK